MAAPLRRHLARIVLLALCCSVAASAAGQTPIKAFFGNFVGQAISESGGEISTRDIAVDIKEHKKGFRLSWTTTTRRGDGRVKRKEHTVDFVPSGSSNVYASAMRRNLFGKAVPMDPLKGDPYVWARLDGPTLIVHALVITEDHGYEMQTYRRTLTDKGMELVFHRVRDGERLRDVTGTLVKVN
ncbi:MAG: hypothetical protein AAF458_19700 [Pseudomonadota bacterium]